MQHVNYFKCHNSYRKLELHLGSNAYKVYNLKFDRFCQRLATIVDKTTRLSKDVTVCNEKDPRTIHYVTTESSAVEIRLYEAVSGDNPAYFLLKYEGQFDHPILDNVVVRTLQNVYRQWRF